MATLRDIYDAHNRYQDAMVHAFEVQLREVVSRAQGKVLAQLQAKLSITEGVIDQTPGNFKILRGLNNLFMSEMEDAGLPQLLETFVNEFPGQLPTLRQVFQVLSDQAAIPVAALDEPLQFTAKDQAVLASLQMNTVASLETAVEIAAGGAMTRSMFSVGGLPFGDLVDSLTQKFETSIARARTLADTGMSTFYRTATDRAFQQVQATQKAELKYRFSGPEDKLTRPFCEHLLEVDKGYTREQIDRMNNGQLPNVFLTGGGWNCRHSWILDVRALEDRAKAA